MTRCLRAWLVAAALGVLCPGLASGQTIDPAFQRDIERMLELTGAQRLGEQLAGAFVLQAGQNMRQANPTMPPRAIEILSEVVRGLFAKEFGTLRPRLVVAYAKVFTHEEVKQLTAFYESPIGRRLAEVSPALAQAGMEAGQGWAQELAPRLEAELRQRLKAEGIVP